MQLYGPTGKVIPPSLGADFEDIRVRRVVGYGFFVVKEVKPQGLILQPLKSMRIRRGQTFDVGGIIFMIQSATNVAIVAVPVPPHAGAYTKGYDVWIKENKK